MVQIPFESFDKDDDCGPPMIELELFVMSGRDERPGQLEEVEDDELVVFVHEERMGHKPRNRTKLLTTKLV